MAMGLRPILDILLRPPYKTNARTCLLYTSVEQRLRLRGDASRRDGGRVIAVITVQIRAHIHADDVALMAVSYTHLRMGV